MTKWQNMALQAAAVCAGVYVARRACREFGKIPLEGRVAIVSGGSRGLGLNIARQLVQHGAHVAILARTQADLDAAAAELRAAGSDVFAAVCDVRDPNAPKQFVQSVIDRWKRVDLLFNVAGVMEVGPLEAMTLEDFHESMNTNCWGALHTVMAVLPYMRQQNGGRIVNVASIGGKRAVPHMIPYDTSKFALVGLSAGLRVELAKDGIVVTTVCPSLMRTGSPRNATFKGKHRAEYAWFSIGGSLPLVSIEVGEAARQIIEACRAGDGEVYIGNTFSPALLAAQLAPGLTAEVLAFVNRWLPGMGGIGQQHAYGYESESALSPSWLTALGDQASQENNQMRQRPVPADAR
jgi:NAD(P)-dependent dehydrogenase (short-subunit alcohol dehydrogenase family)